MTRPKMLILPGNADLDGGSYPDEKGKTKGVKWTTGALHVHAAETYAKVKGYKPVWLNISGSRKSGSETSPQISKVLEKFLGDPRVKAFYGFSGGGYNLYWILRNLAREHPETLHRIQLVVVLGAPKTPQSEYEPSNWNGGAKKKFDENEKKKKDPGEYVPGTWVVVWRDDPWKQASWKVPWKHLRERLWKELWPHLSERQRKGKSIDSPDIDSHMFGPEMLLDETPADPKIPPGDADDDKTEVIEEEK